MDYLILFVLLYLLIMSTIILIKSIPHGYYWTKGKIIRWDKIEGRRNYFPVIEYSDKHGVTKVTALKQYSAGWIKPHGVKYLLIMVDKQGDPYLFSDKALKPLISLSFIILLLIYIVSLINELIPTLASPSSN